jgi:hypothetical protein
VFIDLGVLRSAVYLTVRARAGLGWLRKLCLARRVPSCVRRRASVAVRCWRLTRRWSLLASGRGSGDDSYLVDPASSHMLVSKIKPCMSKYKPQNGETANGSLNQLWFLRSYNPTWITVVILELIHATKLRPSGKSAFIRSRPIALHGASRW